MSPYLSKKKSKLSKLNPASKHKVKIQPMQIMNSVEVKKGKPKSKTKMSTKEDSLTSEHLVEEPVMIVGVQKPKLDIIGIITKANKSSLINSKRLMKKRNLSK